MPGIATQRQPEASYKTSGPASVHAGPLGPTVTAPAPSSRRHRVSQQTAEEKCNCFSDLVHVNREGEFLVMNGTVYKVIETDRRDASDEFVTYIVYTVPREDEEE